MHKNATLLQVEIKARVMVAERRKKGRTDSATFRHCGKCAKKDKYLKNAAMERRQMELGILRENISFTKQFGSLIS